MATLVHQRRHHPLLIHLASMDPQLTRALLAHDDQLARVTLVLLLAVLTARRVLGGPWGPRVADEYLLLQDATAEAGDLLRKDVADRSFPVDLHSPSSARPPVAVCPGLSIGSS